MNFESKIDFVSKNIRIHKFELVFFIVVLKISYVKFFLCPSLALVLYSPFSFYAKTKDSAFFHSWLHFATPSYG